jgi:uncharacterized protein YrrD
MKLDLGCPVRCTDAEYGKLADVVIDPSTRRVTHLVVEAEHADEAARLVPVERARSDDAGITLDATVEEVAALDAVHESAYLRLGEFPVEDPDWDVGVSEMLALPYYTSLDSVASEPIAMDDRVMWRYDRVPKGKIEIRRATPVMSADGHHLGHVDGFVVGSDDHIGELVLERGHLWGRRDVVIPIGAVDAVESDRIVLTLTKDEVGALDSRRVNRWF